MKTLSFRCNMVFKSQIRVSSATKRTLTAIQKARDSLGSESIMYSIASEFNPGIPPSSFMSFLRQVLTSVISMLMPGSAMTRGGNGNSRVWVTDGWQARMRTRMH
ncbi:hypothetical protein E3N88_12438 [Mikania micrantha]|uniref:Uncharacterized protein n=1 Tax=Mikania micrantha TaxID=192012 RepID=A0A5N6P6V0_9ASTR|nr:hypothetical protein E3N88_12438 [Mikania micrantha]